MPKFQKFSSIVTSLIISTTFLTQLSANPTCRVFGLGGTQPKMVCILVEFFKNLNSTTGKRDIPNALIFEGSTGIGKSEVTKAIARETGVEIRVLHLNNVVNGSSDIKVAAEEVKKFYHDAEKYITEEQKPVFLVVEELEVMDASDPNKMHPIVKAISGELNAQIEKHKHNSMIVTVFVTNQPEILDKGLILRCQRIIWSFPDEADRTAIMWHYLKEYRHHLSDAYIRSVIKKSYHFTGRDFEMMFKAANYFALYNHHSEYISEQDFEEAFKNRKTHVDSVYKKSWGWWVGW